jgi:hypothetical protein
MRKQRLFIITILDQAPSSRGDNRHVRGATRDCRWRRFSLAPLAARVGVRRSLQEFRPSSLRSVELSPQAGEVRAGPLRPARHRPRVPSFRSSSHFGETKPMVGAVVTPTKTRIHCATGTCLGRERARRSMKQPLNGQNENCWSLRAGRNLSVCRPDNASLRGRVDVRPF